MSILVAPCLWCDYNGPNYWGEFTHSKECPWYKIGSEIGRQARLRDIVMADLTAKKDLKTIYNSLMIKEGFPINRVVDYIKKLHDFVPVGRSFQERVAWFLGVPLNSSEDELARILGERLKNVDNTEEMWKEYLVEAPPPKKQKDILENMKTLTKFNLLENYTTVSGKYVVMLSCSNLDVCTDELKKAVPMITDYGDIVNLLTGDTLFFEFDYNDAAIDFFDTVIGDDGPTRLNSYNGPARVFACLSGPNGLITENT